MRIEAEYAEENILLTSKICSKLYSMADEPCQLPLVY